MKITKFGHCCLLIENKGKRILTDPGAYSTLQNEVKNLDAILITHEHPDHLHMESLRAVLKNSASSIGLRIITNTAVSKILSAESIACEIVGHNQNCQIGDVLIEGIGEKHAEIYKTLPRVENTGYFIDNYLWYPGDAFTDPEKTPKVLALPVAGPWMKLNEAIDYALQLKPQICFPVHDGGLKMPGPAHFVPDRILTPLNVKFQAMNEGDSFEF